MRKIFLDDLPKKYGVGVNKYKLVIDWKSSIGKLIRFIYDNIEGEVKIINYDAKSHCIWIQYLSNPIYKTRTSNLIYCQLGECLGIYSSEFKYNIGQIIKDDKRNITIIDRFNKEASTLKWYKYRCNKCGWDKGEMNESNITAGNGCSVCCFSSKKVVKGINDIATTHPHLIKYFVNIEDAYNNSYGSEDKVLMKCPNCNFEKYEYVNTLTSGYKNGFTCNMCSDGISYPEKFMFNVLKQLGVEFKTQKTFNWSKNIKHDNPILSGDKKYDFYFELSNEKYIVETHGLQHYEKSFETCGGRSLEEEVENDRIKKELALLNGIKEENYIVVDCRKSELEWIRDHILISRLNELFNLNIIDWLKCEEFALSSRVKEACELWNKGICSTKEIAEIMNVTYKTIIEYLKKGTRLNWCNYNSYESHALSISKKVICITTKEIFNSLTEASKKYKCQINGICVSCKNKNKSAGKHPVTGDKLKWMYYNDYIVMTKSNTVEI